MTAPAWRSLAACRGLDPDTFHPSTGDNEANEAALAICAGCSVTGECLSAALKLGPTRAIGVWGGTSERERDAIHRGRRSHHRRAS